ncbi:MAG: 16S rRNA (cytosine(1402)-N(4))-methyltransferase RsmH [Actinomycetia bacterium]|nr:16S rRNA (cytosine(1402)-N(4))-methyltransferase RsmH [Actinomycetes bacterium]MCP5034368.1 16S rRNA (cytosine(1402)-N(4))-methyltransferase RsmH [Actinomycetes bacterium]
MVASYDSKPFVHRPVMVDEVVALVADLPAGDFLDATVGGGNHASAVLMARADLNLVGLDRDAMAIAAATSALSAFAGRVRVRKTRFDQLATVLDELGIERLSGFLFDLGVSSPQLDEAERGFSFRNDGPLDMRMDTDSPIKAEDIVNGYDHGRLARLIRENSDERFAPRIAKAIIAARPIEGTARLAEVVASAIPARARRGVGHPARRTFQAIRIEVNDELGVIEPALQAALDALDVGGRGMVLTYHSGEDRIVKDIFRRRTRSIDPPGLPVTTAEPAFQLGRPQARRPGPAEQADNPRASSARLRTIERRAA